MGRADCCYLWWDSKRKAPDGGGKRRLTLFSRLALITLGTLSLVIIALRTEQGRMRWWRRAKHFEEVVRVVLLIWRGRSFVHWKSTTSTALSPGKVEESFVGPWRQGPESERYVILGLYLAA